MYKKTAISLLIATALCFAENKSNPPESTLAVPSGVYTFNTVIDLDSNKAYHGIYRYSASRKSNFYLEDTWVNLEYNGKPIDPLLFMNSNIDENYKYMGKDCAFLNGGKTANYRIIICDEGKIMYTWEFYKNSTRRYKFSNEQQNQ